jgi:uncharacterized protein (TIGR02145 family)
MLKTINNLVVKNRIFSVIIMALSLSLMMSSCKKDEPNDATNGKTTAVFNPSLKYGSMTDQDGNVYKTITIGTQTWMAENLRTTKYRDGSAIPNVTGNSDWVAITTGAFCTNNYIPEADPSVTYGRLYNWYTVNDSRNIAPAGWHVPADTEWTTLITYLGGENAAGGKMKEIGITHWYNPNGGATNESGFTALPTGLRESFDGTFVNVGYYGYYWSSTNAWHCEVYYWDAKAYRSGFYKTSGFAVRLVKD